MKYRDDELQYDGPSGSCIVYEMKREAAKFKF